VNSETQSITWRFGGWLAHQPADDAWRIIGVGALLGVCLLLGMYRRTLVSLSLGRRLVLCVLRGALWLGLLILLAAPTRITRFYEQPPKARPLAVLVDRSGSMMTADNRRHRRIDDALRRWRDVEPAAQAAFNGIRTFAFADGIRSVPSVEAPGLVPAERTRFFSALQRALADAPPGGWAGVVTLTDGLDNSGVAMKAGVAAVTRDALATGTPLYFIAGRNRYAGGPFFGLRDWDAPVRTLPKSNFRVQATFDSFQPAASTQKVRFTVNGVARPVTELNLPAGRRLTTWSAEVRADDPGVLELELQVGQEIARTEVRVELPASNQILYYQGALDWSYRFLADILKRDAAFVLTPVFHFPNPNAVLPPGALRQMPASEKDLAPFQIVILANVSAPQLSSAQQSALGGWVRSGGILIFLTPDDDSTEGFSGSELEKMLPVVFAPTNSRIADDASRVVGRFRGLTASDPAKLVAYAWERTPRVGEIFAQAERKDVPLVSPLFSEYAHVARAKPGAEVLARHPTDLAPGSNERAILLAVQRYGRGQSAVLTTDALWRWKLNQPAAERGAELFWQNLFAWLGRDRQHGLAFENPPFKVSVGKELVWGISGAGTGSLKVEAKLGGQGMELKEAAPSEEIRRFPWRPSREGLWEIDASDAGGRPVRHWVSAQKADSEGELSGQAPDEELLRQLAERTGGSVLESTPPSSWTKGRESRGDLLGERADPLWHRPWVFGALLGCYCAELLLRRRWKLL